MSQPTSSPAAPENAGPIRSTSGPSTARVIAAVSFIGCVLVSFAQMPAALRWPVRIAWLAVAGWLLVALIRFVITTRFTARKVLFLGIVGGFYYLVLTLVCHVFINLMSQRDDRLTTRGDKKLSAECLAGIKAALDDNKFTKYSAEMGWVPRPGWGGSGYHVTGQGLRGKKEYSLQPVNPEQRILCMGDSFTFGISVATEDTYTAHAEALRPGTEWLNFGIPGGCLVQSYKRYMHDARAFGGKRVVVGFMTNDAQRTVNAFRPFLNADSGCPLPKPFASMASGRFTIEPNPVGELSGLKPLLNDDNDRSELDRLLKLDYLTWSGIGTSQGPIGRTLAYAWDRLGLGGNVEALFDGRLKIASFVRAKLAKDPYGPQFWNGESPGLKAVCLMFEKFHEQIIADGREPLFVIIPGPLDVDDYAKKRPRQYSSLTAYLTARKLPFIDFLDPLVEKHQSDLSEDAIFHRNHYKGPVNRELAEAIIRALKLP